MKYMLYICVALSVLASSLGKKRLFCDDTESACKEFAARGECRSNPSWLNQICGPSCKFTTLIRDAADYLHDICAPGWTDEGRLTFLRHLDVNHNQSRIVSAFTETGYKVVKIPDHLFEDMLSERETFLEANKKIPQEVRLPGVIDNLVTNKATEFITYSKKLHRDIASGVKPILEEWIGDKTSLLLTDTYGARRYLNGHQAHMHVDQLAKYVISALLNVAQDVKEPWLLHIVDVEGNLQTVALNAGEMLLYESAKCITGYPEPLRGKYYEDFFVHFRPEQWRFSSVPSAANMPLRDEL